jgi:hypothetical protein
MTTSARIVRLVGILGLLGWLGMVGWVAKTSQAQNGGQSSPPALPLPKQGIAAKEVTPPPPIATAAAPAPAQENSDAVSLTKEQGAQAPPPIDLPVHLADKAATAPEPIAKAGEISSPDVAPPGAEDPEQSAQSFVERSQKEAEEHLKALTTEAEQLRARLAKLDSGIRKWQNLLTALKAAQQGQPLAAIAEEPSNLEPIAPGTPGARSDKRVRWASAPAGAASPVTPTAPPAQPAAGPARIAVPPAAPR